MSQVEKQSYTMDSLDAEVLKVLIERFNMDKVNFDNAADAFQKSASRFNRYMDRVALPFGIDKTQYRPNFVTGQLEPIPSIVPQQILAPTTAPDANLPPAPFKQEPDPIV